MNIRNLSNIIIVISLLVSILYSDNKNIIIYDPLYHHGINFYYASFKAEFEIPESSETQDMAV